MLLQMGWNCRIPSCIHASVAAFFAYMAILENRLYLDTINGPAPEFRAMVTVSYAWMLSDLINEAYCGLRGVGYKVAKDNLGHHFVGVTVMLCYLIWVDTHGYHVSLVYGVGK